MLKATAYALTEAEIYKRLAEHLGCEIWELETHPEFLDAVREVYSEVTKDYEACKQLTDVAWHLKYHLETMLKAEDPTHE